MTTAIEIDKGAKDNGFAHMMSDLLGQNLEDHPEKWWDFRRMSGRVAIVVEDADVAITLQFRTGWLKIFDGITGIPDLTIRADSDDVMKMSLVELLPRLGLPDPRGEVTKEVMQASRAGRIRMYGALTNIPLVVRLTRVMSVT